MGGGDQVERGFSFPGAFADQHGTEQITWRVSPSTRGQPPGLLGYEIETTIRGVHSGVMTSTISNHATQTKRSQLGSR